MIRIGAMFAGYGGLELGLREVFPDAAPAWVAEYEPAPSAVLAYRFPKVPNLGDVTTVDWSQVEPVDVLAGGSPCQDLSHAGKRAGMKPGTRSGLWAAMTRAIDELRPEFVLWENVRGALSAEASCDMEPEPGPVGDGPGRPLLRALGRVLGDLASLGYDAGWTSLRAADVGAPHGRFRIFVLGWPAGSGHADDLARLGSPAAQLPERAVAGSADPGPAGAPADGLGRGRPGDDGRAPDEGPPAARVASKLLPTPVASDQNDRQRSAAWQGWDLPSTVKGLLPTPTTHDDAGSRTTHKGGNLTLQGAVGGVSERDAHYFGLEAAQPAEVPLLPTPTMDLAGPHSVQGRFKRDPNADLPLLPTPNPFHMGNDETPDEWRERRLDVHERTGTQHGPALGVVVQSLFSDDPLTPETYLPRERRTLPTPTTADAGNAGSGVAGITLSDVTSRDRRAEMLLPTPDVSRALRGTTEEDRLERGQQVGISDIAAGGVIGVAPYFGPYAPAVRLWEEISGRPAPAPTEGKVKTGLPALSPRFVEWMMGLPEGWVTEVPGLTRASKLAMLGNGVVPAQAAAAVRHLLEQREQS